MRVAVASSGLGHVRRGIESWAEDLGIALHRAGVDVTLFQGAGKAGEQDSGPKWRRTLPCLRRFESPNARILSVTRRLGGWRFGFGNEYEVEQSTFAWALWKAIRSGYDILHVQDPKIALIMDRLYRMGLSGPKVILAHGTEEPVELLQKYSYLQHLAPVYQQQYELERPPAQLSLAVPNFIDIAKFAPGDRRAARALFGLPADTLIVLCVAALKKHHKRCDYLIREFCAFKQQYGGRSMLVMAGAHEVETPEIVELGRSLLGDSVLILEGLDRAKLVSLYQAADVFTLASLHEMMPIALLEGIASGLPVACNDTATLKWMAGPAGIPCDISLPGGLVTQWRQLSDPERRLEFSTRAREWAEATFSETVVIEQVKAMYGDVLNNVRDSVSIDRCQTTR